MQEYEAGILRTECCGQNIHILELSCNGIASKIIPGQFVQVRAGKGTDPFLRRTFSVCRADPNRGIITLLVDEVGPGTAFVCSLKRGESLNVIGPLGAGFNLEYGIQGSSLLVGGGTGAAPLVFLANTLISSGAGMVTFLEGARTDSALRFIDGLVDKGIVVLKATDDGSSGFYGMVSELLEQKIDSIKPNAIYTCGPHAMMKTIIRIAESRALPCQVSLEERMACGIGACLGCAVLLKDGRMVRSCVDGPVFNASEIVL